VPFEYEYHFIEYEYEYERAFLGYSGDHCGQSLVSCFFVLSPPRRTVLVLLLVLEFLTRLGANTIFEAFESMNCRKLTARVSGASFEYEYHFIEYEYEYERTFLGTLIPGEPENKKSPHGGVPSGLVFCWREDRSSNSGARSVTDREGPGRRPPLLTKTYS
jgi:hypothetical protein